MGEANSVGWNFERRGVMTITGAGEDAVMEAALEAGALDVVNHGEDGIEVRTEAHDVHKIADALARKGFKVSDAKATYLPGTTVKLDEEKAPKVLRLMELLEDNDDVQNVYANFEIDEALLDKLAG